MRRSGNRVGAVVGAVLAVSAGLSAVLLATPVSAQEGTQAAVLVGGPVASCPPGVAADAEPFFGTADGVQLAGAGQCTPTSDRAAGYYTIPGFSPQGFEADCAIQNGTIVTSGGVYVPEGTIVNGQAVPGGTLITTENQFVTFPNGQTAVLNQVIVGQGTVTRNAIAFTNGPIIGQVVCGAAAAPPPPYPLAVEPSLGGAAPVELPSLAAEGDGGSVSTVALLGGALVLVVLLAQVAVARRIGRNER